MKQVRSRRVGHWKGVCGALLAALAMQAARSADAAPTPEGTLLVLNKSENTLAFVNPDTFKVEDKVAVGVGPHEVTVSADGKRAYVANYGDQNTVGKTISVIDLVARKEIKRVDTGDLGRPHGLAEVKGKLYFTAEMKQTVGRYDPVADKIDWTASTGQNITHMLVPSPDGNTIYTTNILSDSVSVVDIATKESKSIPVGPKPEALDIAPNGKELWVGRNGDGKVAIIDTTSGKVKEIIEVGKVPIRVKFTPNGKQVLISDVLSDELVIVEAATRKVVKRVKVGSQPVGVLVAPDGKRAYVATMAANQVVVVDLAKRAVVGRIEPGGMPDGLAWVTRQG